MKRFDAYEIRNVAEFCPVEGSAEIMPISDCADDTLADAAEVFWSLYGWRDGEGVECIADRQSYADIRELYFSITGVDCGADEQDHFNLPRAY